MSTVFVRDALKNLRKSAKSAGKINQCFCHAKSAKVYRKGCEEKLDGKWFFRQEAIGKSQKAVKRSVFIPSFKHSGIQANHQTIKQSNNQIIKSSNNQIIESSNNRIIKQIKQSHHQTIKQSYHQPIKP